MKKNNRWTVDKVSLDGIYHVGCHRYGTVVYNGLEHSFRWLDNTKLEVPADIRAEVLGAVAQENALGNV